MRSNYFFNNNIYKIDFILFCYISGGEKITFDNIKKYVSVDIEASGRSPGKYSMLSLGACIVGDTSIQFYRELKPISDKFIYASMKIGCLELECTKDKGERYDATSPKFSPRMVLDVLKEEGQEPKKVMNDFREWVVDSTKDYLPIIAATPMKVDGMFITWYFDNFCKYEDPFGYGGEDMNSVYHGKEKDRNVHMAELGLRPQSMPHHALQDAIIQAKEFEAVLKGIR